MPRRTRSLEIWDDLNCYGVSVVINCNKYYHEFYYYILAAEAALSCLFVLHYVSKPKMLRFKIKGGPTGLKKESVLSPYSSVTKAKKH